MKDSIRKHITDSLNLNLDNLYYFDLSCSYKQPIYKTYKGYHFSCKYFRRNLFNRKYGWLEKDDIISKEAHSMLYYIPIRSFDTFAVYSCTSCKEVFSAKGKDSYYDPYHQRYSTGKRYLSMRLRCRACGAYCAVEGAIIDYKTKETFTEKPYYFYRNLPFNIHSQQKHPRFIVKKRLYHIEGHTYVMFNDKNILLSQQVVDKILETNSLNEFLYYSHLK